MAATKWLTESEMRAWQTLLTATSSLLAVLDRELQAEHGLALPEYEVLVFLADAGDYGIRMSELAERLHLSPSGLTRRIDGLVTRRLVRREQCPSDRRGFLAVLAPLGRAKLEQAAPTHVRGVREHFVDRLSDRQLSNLTAALSTIDVDPSAAAGGCDDGA
ncbi:MAG: MarR family winged helix-turn-helix transcriptional regulator [Actinomycetota bacterium]